MMDLTKVLSKKNSDHKDYYWSVAIEPDWVQVSLWYSQNDCAYIVSLSTPTPWQSDKELIDAVDAALSYVVQNTHEEIGEPSKTVFGVIDSWVENGQIKTEYLERIKKVCQELSLTPTGFVVISEAIANYIKSMEGSPFTGVVLGLSKEFLNITLFKTGNVVAHSQVSRSISVVDDAVEGLTRMNTGEAIPSRFLIYNAKKDEIEDAKQALVQAQWEDYSSISFLHTPKVEMIESDKKIEAVSLGGASDLSKVTKIVTVPDKLPETVNNFEVNEATKKITSSLDKTEYTDLEELGFTIGKDIAQGNVSSPVVSPNSPNQVVALEQQVVEEAVKPKKKLPINLAFLGKFKPKIIKPSLSLSMSMGKKMLVIGLSVLALVIVLGLVAWWVFPKASITMYLATQKLDEKLTITIDPLIDTADIENKILPGVILAKDLEGSKTKSTTGAKTVGEKAVGEVSIYRVGSSIVLDQGIEVSGPQGLNFTLDEEVEVASGSAVTPGVSKAKVTANDIGADYNLAAESTFTVGNYSSSTIGAKNESSFSGGSSREINAVSESDQEDLFKDLSEELKEKGLDELEDELIASSDCQVCKLVPESFTITDSNKDYSAKVGDEADNLGLDLSLKTQTVALSETDLVELAKNILAQKIPEGYVLRDDQINTNFEFIEENGGKYVFSVNVSANLFPQIDPADVADKIAGKYPEVAKDYFTKEIPSFVRAEISMKHKLPSKLATLPHLPKNIEIIITSEN